MNRRVVRNTLIGTALLLVAGGAGYGFLKWQGSRPTQDNFDKAARALFASGNLDRFRGSTGNSLGNACVNIPRHPAPDARSKSSMPLVWYMDFLIDAPASEARTRQLRQLDALTTAGLLVRTPTVMDVNGEIKSANRYSLTDKGWAATSAERQSTCLVYGTPQYLGITSFAPREVSPELGMEVYEVHVRSGIKSAGELQPWARDPEVMAAFPDIRDAVAGQDITLLMVRGNGAWVEYQELLRGMRTSQVDTAKIDERERELRARLEKEIAEIKDLPTPTVDEVKALLSARYGPGKVPAWPAACLELPGDSDLPVDKRLATNESRGYAVAIFQDKERKPYDRVVSKTAPYLETLARLGVLSTRLEPNVPGDKRDQGAVYQAQVYELTPEYADDLDTNHSACLALGEPTLELIDVTIKADNREWSVHPEVSFKLKINYRNPPEWARNPALQAGWDDLRGALEHGYACDGRYVFNKKKRDLEGGGGTCWWAFNSYKENG